ncbi:MAG: pilus assembly protein [Acidobacteria bacterium]|jgi:Flp pilus assembly protein TadG|nr:pilus assembly protein [Acidobacteriota bacterium]
MKDTLVDTRRRTQSGHAFLEASLVLVPLLAIVFAITDYSMAIFLRATFQHAVREGVRYAITFQTMSGMCQDASIRQVVRNSSAGFLGSAQNELIKITYHPPSNLSQTLIGVGSNAAGNIVEVSVEDYSYSWMVPLMRSNTPLNITVRAADRTESLPGGATTPPCR